MGRSRQPLDRIVCPACGRAVPFQADYFCTDCGAHNDALYRAEHVTPQLARHMTRADIEAEYAAAGISFRHNANYEATASALLQSLVMQEVRHRKGEQ